MAIACPRCEQEWIRKVYIGKVDKTVFLCYECEATWFSESTIGATTWLDLSTFLEREGVCISRATYATFRDEIEWPFHPSSPG